MQRPDPVGGDVGSWRSSDLHFLRRVLIVTAIAGLALLLWAIRSALLLAFAAMVVAVLLLAAATPLERWWGLRRVWSLTVLGAVLVLAVALAGVTVGSQFRSQVAQLGERLPGAVQEFEAHLAVLQGSTR